MIPDNGPVSWSFDLPDKLKVMIADAVTTFSHIDSLIIETRWINEGADLARKKALAKKPAVDNIAALKEMIERLGLGALDATDVWGAFDQLKDDRNLVSHGVWMVDDKGVPWVVWHSKFLESDDFVTGEQFPYGRLDRMLRIASRLRETLVKFKGVMEDLAKARAVAEAGTPPVG